MFITPIRPIQGIGTLEEMNNSSAGGANTSVPFANVLQSAMDGYAQAKEATDSDAAALAIGDVDNLAQVQINSMKAESMLQTTVQLTTRMVNAYKEIMQMQI